MPSQILRALAAGALIVTLATPTAAQAPPPATAAPAVSAKAEALVRRYLQVIHFERLMDSTMAAMLPVMVEGMARQNPNITADQRQIVSEVVQDALREDMMPKVIDRMVPLYATTFSERELEAIVGFYESEPGQAIIEKTPSLAPKSAQIVRDLMPEMQRDMLARLCAKLDCSATPHSKPKAS